MALVETTSVEETRALGRELAAGLVAGDVVLLDGELGAGKTQIAKGIAEGLGVSREVASPTYAVCMEYACGTTDGMGGGGGADGVERLWHFDLYRLEDAEELWDVGFFEALEGGGVVLVEWAEKFADEMPGDCMRVRITVRADGTREVRVSGGEHGTGA